MNGKPLATVARLSELSESSDINSPDSESSESQATGNADASGLPLNEDHGWPQYRGGIRRVGYADTSAVKTAHVQWVSKRDVSLDVPAGHDMHRDRWLDRPTPPVTARGLAFYGSSDGSVRAVRIEDGQTAWTFWSGGAVLTSPAVSNGRLITGSNDGWVYCLDGAPADRRSVMYGKLTSLWSVTTVMVADGKVYGVAGQAMQNGSVTFALDAESGKPQWTTWTEPAYESRTILEREDFGFSPAGQLTLLGGNLVDRTYLGIPAVFNAESGKRIPPSPAYRELCQDAWAMGFRTATSGQDLIVLDDNTVMQGGYPLLGNPDIRHDKSAAKFVAWRIEDNGEIPVSPLPWWAVPHSQIAPALDDTHIALVGGVGKDGRSANSTVGLSLWLRDKWRTELQRIPEAVNDDPDARDPAATPFQQRRADQAALQAEVRRFKTSLDMEKAEWRVDDADVSAVALADDAVVAVLGERDFGRRGNHPGFAAWKLCAFDRTSGKELWSAELPGEPIFNGIAPAADGSWVLTLRDGSLLAVGSKP